MLRIPYSPLPLAGMRPAAVLLPLVVRSAGWTVLLTRRTDHLPHHRGEISFPGGGAHVEDADLVATALRETEEELGIAGETVRQLGRLNDSYSVHGYHVAAFVGLLPEPPQFRVNPAEIAEVIELPLRDCCVTDRWYRENWRHRGRLQPVHFLRVGGYEVWGLTAAILREFLERCDLLKR